MVEIDSAEELTSDLIHTRLQETRYSRRERTHLYRGARSIIVEKIEIGYDCASIIFNLSPGSPQKKKVEWYIYYMMHDYTYEQ